MVLFFEIFGVLLMAAAWMVSIARMIESRRWSPMRPAVMAIVMTGCLALMAQTLVDYAESGVLRNTFYLAAWNLGMALFDCKIALFLARRGDLTTTRRKVFAGFTRQREAEEAFQSSTVLIAPSAEDAAPRAISRPSRPVNVAPEAA